MEKPSIKDLQDCHEEGENNEFWETESKLVDTWRWGIVYSFVFFRKTDETCWQVFLKVATNEESDNWENLDDSDITQVEAYVVNYISYRPVN